MKRIIQAGLFLLLAASSVVAQPSANKLGDIVKAMTPGTWAQINTFDDGSGWAQSLVVDAGSSIFTFSTKGIYDPISDRVMFAAESHGGAGAAWIRYSTQTNTWLRDTLCGSNTQAMGLCTQNVNIGGIGHTYDGHLFDPIRRLMIVGSSPTNNAAYDLTQGSNLAGWYQWDGTAASNSCGGGGTNFSQDYFADRDEYLCFEYNTGFTRLVHGAGAWAAISGIGASSTVIGQGAEVRCTSVLHQCLIFGGRLPNLLGPYVLGVYKYDINGTITQMGNAPADFRSAAGEFSVSEFDPISGDLIVLAGHADSTPAMWKYHPQTDTWTEITSTNPPANLFTDTGYPEFTVDIPLPKYGVIMYLTADPRHPLVNGVYVYKHANTPFETKCTATGVLTCHDFYNQSELRYAWDPSDTTPNGIAINALLTGSTICLGGCTRFTPSGDFTKGTLEPNILQEVTAESMITIDYSCLPSGFGWGCLRLPTLSHSGQADAGKWVETLDYDANASPHLFIAPGSAHGNELWEQWNVKVNAPMVDTAFGGVALLTDSNPSTVITSATTSGANATTVTDGTSSGRFFTDGSWSGRTLFIPGNLGVNWLQGFYTIDHVIDSNNILLTTSPTPTGAGSGGKLYIQGPPWIQVWQGTLSATLNSTTIVAPAGTPFTSGMVGAHLIFGFPNAGNNCDPGQYTVNSITNSTHAVLDRTPASSGNCTNGFATVGPVAGGWKINITYGDPPIGNSSSSDESTINGTFDNFNYPLTYGCSGTCADFQQTTCQLTPNVWHEITEHWVVGASGAHTALTWYMDAVQCSTTTTHTIVYGGAGQTNGYGTNEFTQGLTNKDPNNLMTGGNGYTWIANHITSTEPIVMGSIVNTGGGTKKIYFWKRRPED